MTTPGLPLRRGDVGAAVRDLHHRLAAAGVEPAGRGTTFDTRTEEAVATFQRERGLVADGICGPQTWASLVEAGNRLGDRMLYLRSPMTRGEDVTELQQRLGNLGFDAGWVDGIFGPDTEAAVRDFQHNQGLTADGVVGTDTVAALSRISGRISGDRTVAAVRELERLRDFDDEPAARRIVVGESGGVPAVIDAVSRRLRIEGVEVLALHHPDLSVQAKAANEWDGSVYLGITLASDDLSIAYFATEGFASAGGRALAGRCAERLAPVLGGAFEPAGLRLPILRETRMPAVWCRIGPAPLVVERSAAVTAALGEAVMDWCRHPIDDEPSSTP